MDRWWGDPRVKPPFGSAEIDWGHPLATDLHDCVLLNEGGGTAVINLGPGGTPGSLVSVSGGLWPAWSGSVEGLAVKPGSQTSTTKSEIRVPSHGGFTGQLPAAMRIRVIPNVYASNYNMLAEKGTTSPASDAEFGIYINATGSAFSWIYFGGGAGVALSGGSVTVGRVHDIVCTRDSVGLISVYLDGQFIVSKTLTGVLVSPNNWRLGNSTMGGTLGAEMTYLVLQSWRRSLTPTEVLGLWTEPYAFLRPILRRRYFVPAAVAANTAGPLVGSRALNKALVGGKLVS